MNDLPAGWTVATLSDVGEYQNGRGFKKSEWALEGRPIIRIQNLTGSGGAFNFFAGELEDRYVVPTGSLLVSWAATLGVYVWNGPEGALNQHIFKVKSHINPAFHRWALEHALDEMRRQSHGSGMVHITKARFDETVIPVPPVSEQERIVDAIEAAFSRIDAGVAYLEAATRRLDVLEHRIRESVLNGSWEWTTLGALLSGIEAGKSFRTGGASAGPDEWGVVKVSAMTYGSFRPAENKALPRGTAIDPAWVIRQGDVLLSRANTSEYVGATVLVDVDPGQLILSDKSLRLVPKPATNARWLQLALAAPGTRSQISAVATGVKDSMRNISQEKLRSIRLPLPPLADQLRLVETAEQQLARLWTLRSELKRSAVRSAGLRRSVLESAFSGHLAHQDPTDEPVELLLERLRTGERQVQRPGRRSIGAGVSG